MIVEVLVGTAKVLGFLIGLWAAIAIPVLLLERRKNRLLAEFGRCPWTTALSGAQCTKPAGHGGQCITEVVIRTRSGSASRVDYRYWWGINYTVNGRP